MIQTNPHLLLGYGRLGQRIVALDNIFRWITVRKNPIAPAASFVGDIKTMNIKSWPHFDTIVYAMAPTANTQEAYQECFVHNLKKVLSVLSFNKFIMCSSTAVFSETAGRMINEDSSVIPKNFRQEALLEGERLVRFYAWSNYAIMRLSGLYDNQLPPPDSWEQTNSWANRIHLDDAAQFILAAALPSLKLQEIFCLTDDHPFVPQDIASLFHLRKANHKYFETYSKRISNLKAKSMLRNILMYPSVHQGYSDFLRIN